MMTRACNPGTEEPEGENCEFKVSQAMKGKYGLFCLSVF